MKIFFVIVLFYSSIFKLHAQEIKKIKISDLEAYIQKSDHPLIINFWATYCSPCLKEIPYFEKFVAEQKDKNVELLLVSLDLPTYYPAKISSFVKDKKFASSVWWLNETNADYFCPKISTKWSGAIPATLIINPKTGYRKFFEDQLKPEEFEMELKLAIGDSKTYHDHSIDHTSKHQNK